MADLLMYGSNYPNWSATGPQDVVTGLDDEQRRKVLWHNASSLYDFPSVTEGSVR